MTKVGKTVSKVRRAARDWPAVEKSAKMLIAAWKRVAGQDDKHGGSHDRHREGEGSHKDRERRESINEPPAKRSKPTSPPSAITTPTPRPNLHRTSSVSSLGSVSSASHPARKSSAAEVEFRACGDTVRDSCRRMLAQALNGDGSDLRGANPGRLAVQLEEELYKQFNDTSNTYKNAVRSRRSNLVDPKNTLRAHVLSGVVSPSRLAIMTNVEMANKDVLKAIQEAHRDNLHDAQMGGGTTTQTDMFKCGKCKKNNCSYYQMQTRSADEPMTTFVSCNVCGNKWK
eukprot:Ihof_evm3s651 gene=Ihof_evmTU3s651